MQIEFFESSNDLVIKVEWKLLIELIWCNPGNVLSHNFNLIVDSLNAEEWFLETLGDCAVSHPFFVKALGHFDVFTFDLEALMLWEVSEEWNQTKCIVKVSQGINESWISLFDNMAQTVSWGHFFVVFGSLELFFAHVLLIFNEMRLNFLELGQQLVVFQDLEILNVEVCFVAAAKLLFWLSWVNAFKNTKSSEVLEW